MGRFLFVLLSFILLSLSAQATENKTQDAEALLRAIQEKKAQVLQALNQLNGITVSTAMQKKIDGLWTSPALVHPFNQHYAEIEAAIAHVGIREDSSFFDIIWAQYKAIVDEENLEKLVTEFIDDALKKIQPYQEQAMTQLLDNFHAETTILFNDAQTEVKQQLDQIFARRFENWSNIIISMPPPIIEKKDFPQVRLSDSTHQGEDRIAGITGIVMLVLSRKIRQLIIKRVTTKIIGALAGKSIPYIGWALLGYDLATAFTAKEKMEELLRLSFIAEYKLLFTPGAVWKDSKEQTLSHFNSYFLNWFETNKTKIRTLVEAADLLQHKTYADYAKERLAQGVDIDVLARELLDIYAEFGHISFKISLQKLLLIKIAIPTDAESNFLARVVDAFGEEIVTIYDKYGGHIMTVIWSLSIEESHTVIKQNQDIIAIYDKFIQFLSPKSPLDAKKGFFIALRQGLDLSPPWTENLFSALYQFQHTLTPLLQRTPIDLPKLKQVLADTRLLAMLQSLEQQRQDLFLALFDGLSTLEMHRYLAPERLQALLKLYQTLAQQQGMSAEQYVRTVQQEDSLLSIYLDYGVDGSHIWNQYINKESGQVQRNLAHKALDLYKNGWALEICLDAEAVNYADKLRSWPLGGVLFTLSYPIYKGLGLVGSLILAVMILALLSAIMYWLRRIFSHAKTPPPPPSVTYPSYPLSTTTHYTIESLENKKLPPTGKPQ
jgi:hypothetical protein